MNGVVILAYQRIGENSGSGASLSLENFKTHLRELQGGDYTVISLVDAIDAIKNNKQLPHKPVVITFDGAYKDTFKNALPLLDEADYPYTFFYAADMHDGPDPALISWGDLKSLSERNNVELGILPAQYTSLATIENEKAAALINKAVGRYEETFAKKPRFFALPYGEYSASLKKMLAGYGFGAVLGQQAGVLHAQSDFASLPRFTMTDEAGSIDRFRLAAGALPLPLHEIIPDNPVITDNPPMVGFSVPREIGAAKKLSCFMSGHGKLDIKYVTAERVEIRPPFPLESRRTRINCTVPLANAPEVDGAEPVYHWAGFIFINPQALDDAPLSDDSGFE